MLARPLVGECGAPVMTLLVVSGLSGVGVATLPQAPWNGLTGAPGVWLCALQGGRVHADGVQLPCLPCADAGGWRVECGDYVVTRFNADTGMLSVAVNGVDVDVCRVPAAVSAALSFVVCLYRGDEVRYIDVAPQARWLVRARALCLSGRAAAAADSPLTPAGWLCTAAPFWVFQRVCALLRDL